MLCAGGFSLLQSLDSRTVLEGLEKDAREAKKGLWADPQPVPPWEWRKQGR
jgi:endonuclease YncB( thermonuclease family)